VGKSHTPQDILRLYEEARAEGVDLSYDNYPYTRGSSLLHSRLPAWTHVGGPDAIIARLKDPEQRTRIEAELDAAGNPWDQYTMASITGSDSKLEGWTVAEAANEAGKAPATYVCDVLVETDLGVSFVSPSTSSEESLDAMLAHELATHGSDGLCIGSKRHPRSFGSFARVLGRFVRERKVMPLAEAVRKMTSASALRIGLKDRGLVREGFVADLAVWDENTIADRSTWEQPMLTAQGVSHVLVSGQVVLDNGEHTGATPGRALKPLLG
jgi:N-acyl-D-amino-acid deacylase